MAIRPADVDIAIVGAGPAGLYGAYYAGFRGLRTAVIDSLPEPGGQVTALYPEKLIFDVAGFPSVKGRELVELCLEQADRYDPDYYLGHRAEDLQRCGDGRFVLSTHRGAEVVASSVLITGGIGTFAPRPLPAAEGLEGRGLVYFVRELEAMRDLDVLIVGGGDSAFDWALNLEGIARTITLVHRRDRFRAHEDTVRRVLASSVDVRTFAEVTEVHGEDHVEAVSVVNSKTGETDRLAVQAIVAALGFVSDLGPLRSWGIDIEGRHLPVDSTMGTSVEGVFAAGDIADYPGKVRLISVGFGEAATAVNNAAVHVDPSARVFPGHSSDHA